LNPKVEDDAIPKKTCIADAMKTRVEKLDDTTVELIQICNQFDSLAALIHFYSGNKVKD